MVARGGGAGVVHRGRLPRQTPPFHPPPPTAPWRGGTKTQEARGGREGGVYVLYGQDALFI